MDNLIRVCNINKKYNTVNGEIVAIKDVSFDIKKGEFIAIVGSSGCGKSTLLSIIAGMIKQSSGNIIYNKENLEIGYMLQEDALFEHYTVLDNVLLGLKVKNKLNENNINRAINLLKKYNLYEYKDKKPSQLSGGMKQRVALIRTLAIDPDILFLDEPFSALDYKTRLEISNDVYKIVKDSKKVLIMVTHDINEAISMADKVIILSKRPAVVKNIYNIDINNNLLPTMRRKDKKYNYYYDLIWDVIDE